MSTFAQTLDQILDTYWRLHPIEATHTGIHTHDAAMPDWSAAGQQARRDWQSHASAQLTRFADADLSHDERLDKQVLLAQMALFQIYDEWGYAKRAPALYIEQALNGLHFLLARPDQTAPQAVRDANLLARLSAIPPLLQQAQANLDPALIPPEFIEIALPNVKGAVGFIASLELPESFRAAHTLRSEEGLWEGVASEDKDPRKSLHVGEIATPEIAPDEVYVAVMASAINFNTVWTSIF
ncbi:MAG: DUF885 family protein, partial [Chloroflexota bacterium]